MPRLGNVRLSVKLGLCFGSILTLTAAIIADTLVNIAALESAHERDKKGLPVQHSGHNPYTGGLGSGR